ncbi:hypothetical protein ABLE92_07400 [Gordonia sp. VNQ95]|uniref:hypothetical protein n=1 Tax=Gordonia TaxID=2053 RepID=UPI0032B552BC
MTPSFDDDAASGPRDVNGRPIEPTRLQRMATRFGRRGPAPGLRIDDADLVVVAVSVDDAASSSAVLEASAWRPEEQAVVRHLVVLPHDRVTQAVALAAQDGYARTRPDAADLATVTASVVMRSGSEIVVLARAQLLDALHLSQERSRMASLGARHGGTVVGWQVLQRQ